MTKRKKTWHLKNKHREHPVSKAALLPKPDPTLSNHKRMELRRNARNYHIEMQEQMQEQLKDVQAS